MKGEPAPYYIEYEIDDISSMRAIARLGGIVDDLSDHSRTLRVQVRVGDYAFDSSRFVTQDRGAGAGASTTIPLDDNYDAIRREAGRLVASGEPRTILANLHTGRSIRVRLADGEVRTYKVSSDEEQVELLQRLIVAEGVPVLEFVEESGGLEALFLQVTQGVVQ
jgi:hypothetical protein